MASKAATSGVNLQRFRNPYWHVHQQKLKKEKLYMHNLKRARGATDFRGKPIFTPRTWNVTKGDLVQVTQPSLIKDFATGKAKQNQFGQSMTQKWLGQQGVVLAVLRKEERVIVEGINLKTRVMRPSEQSRGFHFQQESPIPYQHVTLVDPSTGLPAVGRIKRTKVEGSRNTQRIVLSSGTTIPTPNRHTAPKAPARVNLRTDTAPADVLAETYIAPEYIMPQAVLREDGTPDIVEEEVPLSAAELLALTSRPVTSLSKADQRNLRTRTKIQLSTIMKPESTELRAARIKF